MKSRPKLRRWLFWFGLCSSIALIAIGTYTLSVRVTFVSQIGEIEVSHGTLRAVWWKASPEFLSQFVDSATLPQIQSSRERGELEWKTPSFEVTDLAPTVVSWILYVPLWLLLCLTGGPTLFLWWRMRRDCRLRPGHCTNCGYSLRDNMSGTCPECGTADKRVRANSTR
jgi:hypothetical protein